MDLDLGRDGAEEMRSTRLDRSKRGRKSWLKAIAQGLSPVRGKSRSPVRHFTQSPSDKSSKLDVYSLTFEGLEREEPRSSESTCKDQLSPLKMDFKDLSPTCFAHGGSLGPLGTSGSVRSFLSPGPLSDRMEMYEPERTPPSEQRGASPERAGSADGASFDGRSSGEYCALPDILESMKQVPYSDSESGSDWTGLTPNPPESPGYSWQQPSAGHYSPLSQPRSSLFPDDVASENHLRLPRASSLPTMSPLSSRLTVCSRYSEDDLTPWITTRDRGRRRGRLSAASFAEKLAAGRGCSPSKLSERGSSTSSSDGLWRETEPLHFPLNVDEDEVVTGRSIPSLRGGDVDDHAVKNEKGEKGTGSSPGDGLAWQGERFQHALVAGGDDGHGSLGWKGLGIRAVLADILRAVKCIFHACLPPDRRRQP